MQTTFQKSKRYIVFRTDFIRHLVELVSMATVAPFTMSTGEAGTGRPFIDNISLTRVINLVTENIMTQADDIVQVLVDDALTHYENTANYVEEIIHTGLIEADVLADTEAMLGLGFLNKVQLLARSDAARLRTVIYSNITNVGSVDLDDVEPLNKTADLYRAVFTVGVLKRYG